MRDALEQADHDLWAAIPAGDDTGGRRYRCGRETLRRAFAIDRRRSCNQSQLAGTPAKGGSARFVRCAETISPSWGSRTGGNRSLKGERQFRRRGRRTWITKASALDGLNDEARAILMAIIETGAPCERDLQSRARSHLRRCGNPAHPHH
jgi:hypothetical protein